MLMQEMIWRKCFNFLNEPCLVLQLAVSRSGDVCREAGGNFCTTTISSCDKQLRLVLYLVGGCLLLFQGWFWLYKSCIVHLQHCIMVCLLLQSTCHSEKCHAKLLNRSGSQFQIHTTGEQMGLKPEVLFSSTCPSQKNHSSLLDFFMVSV